MQNNIVKFHSTVITLESKILLFNFKTLTQSNNIMFRVPFRALQKTVVSTRRSSPSFQSILSVHQKRFNHDKVEENPLDAEPTVNDNEETILKLQSEIKELKDQVIRSYAEEENVRRIAKRDVENARVYANSSFAKALLDVADNLERALSAVPEDKRKGTDPILNSLVEGIDMTEKNLQKVFSQFNITKYGSIGDKFDPSLHDALFQVPDATKESGLVSAVLKTGYKLKDRVIRAAQVGTTGNP